MEKVLAKTDYEYYLEYVHRGIYRHARHTKLISNKLKEVEEGKCKRLMIFLPPRHSKSMTVSETFPSYFIGRNLDRRVILTSYGDSLARKFGRANRNKLEEYGQEIFGISLSKDNSSVTNWGIEGYRGGMISAGIGGPITGEGADLLIIDDPIKNRKEADSKTYRDMVWDEWQNTLYTRLQPDGAVIIILTRWHEDDLAGRLLNPDYGPVEDWDIIRLPAIAEENDLLGREIGEPLWAEYGFDKDWAKDTKVAVGSRTWASLYQQRPAPAEGNKFKRQWFRRFEEMDSYYILHTPNGDKTILKEDCWRFQTADTASSEKQSADYTVLTDLVVTPDNDILVDDVFRDRIEVPEQEKIFQARYNEKKPSFQAIENKNTGIALRQYLIRKGLPIKELKADTDKVTRAATIMVMYENGKVYHRKGAAWLEEWEDELITFPTGKHDDQVDTASYAGIIVTQIKPYKEKKSRPKGVRRRR